ncbi:hypothetical protein Tco_1085251 [Tanacetum coccineum]
MTQKNVKYKWEEKEKEAFQLLRYYNNAEGEGDSLRLTKIEGKLNPKNIGPFKNLAKVGIIAYRLELLQQLNKVHSTLHLKECWSNETLVIPLDEIQIDDKLYFIEETVKIIDRDVRRLNQSRIPTVKVRWNSKRGPKSTWERED